MGEIIKPKEITNTVNVHTFYCDECMKKYQVKLIKCLETFGFKKEEI